MLAAFALVLALATPSPAPACAAATDALARAQRAWRAFTNGDFVEHAAQAEAQRRVAIAQLARADAAARRCPKDPTAAARAELHYEMAVVEARRKGAALPVPPLPPRTEGGRCAQPDAPAHPLGSISPIVTDPSRLRRPHGSTAVSIVVAADGTIVGTLVTASSGDPVLDQAVVNAARLLPYAPARIGCRSVQGEYRFTYTFPQL